jgi:hypothetical protein
MTDGVNVDWGLLKSPDYVGDYANAFTVGRQMAQQQGEAGAASAPANALTATASAGDPLEAQIGALDGPGRARAAEQADLLASLGSGLRAYPYAQRPGILAHLAPALAARGVPRQVLARFDPTDEALAAVRGQALALGARLQAPGS